jgi:hypothetical protein
MSMAKSREKTAFSPNAAQDAPVIYAGEEWAFLVWGWGTGGIFGFQTSSLS